MPMYEKTCDTRVAHGRRGDGPHASARSGRCERIHGDRAHPAFVCRVGDVGEVQLANSQGARKGALQRPYADRDEVRLRDSKRDEEARRYEDADQQNWTTAETLTESTVARRARKLAKEVGCRQEPGEERHVGVRR